MSFWRRCLLKWTLTAAARLRSMSLWPGLKATAPKLLAASAQVQALALVPALEAVHLASSAHAHQASQGNESLVSASCSPSPIAS